jgi:serine/threonine protein kinase
VFDNKGYLKITDFGIAKYWQTENYFDTSGTPGYMAPEVMCRQNHGIAVDYYALGIICYECMMGRVFHLSRGRMWGNAEKTSEIAYFPSKYKSKNQTYPMAGPYTPQISSIS